MCVCVKSMMNAFTHTYTLSLSLSHTHTSIRKSVREGYWDGKRCVFRPDLKADVELEWQSEIGRVPQKRPHTRICVVQRISDGMKECEGDGSQRKSEAVEEEHKATEEEQTYRL